ncbi:MAG TPA: hypothetical protein VF498_01800 [Anaerolineales bacterium]
MEHQTPSNTVSEQPFRIPVIGWVLGAGLLIALVAIFVFGVSASTVGYYAFFALMIGSHFFMHGGHGGHGGNNHTEHKQEGAVDAGSQPKDEHAGHSGSCH